MRKWNKLLALLLAMVMAFSLMATGFAADAEDAEGEETPVAQAGDIVILHTNDVHGKYAGSIGYAGLAAYKAEVTEAGAYATLVDAGDFSQGEAIAILSKGGYLIDIMNEVGYDIVVPGNHEFDYGMETALENLNALDATVVSCNFVDLKEDKPVFDAYTIVEYGETKVAYVGMSTPETYTKSTPTYFQDESGEYIYSFCENELYETVQTAVDAARAEGVDYVVAIGHMGIDEQSSPWTSREVIANTTGIDVFIDGHSHSKIENETVANKDGEDVVLAQTGTKLSTIGKVTIASDGTITAELVSEYEPKDEEVTAFIEGIEESYAEITAEVVAQSDVDLIAKNEDDSWAVRTGETNMGDLIADAYRTVMDADIGIMNGGGIRANIAAGEVTMADILAVMTFGNMATVVEATGQQILDCLEMGASAYPGASGGFTHVSGLTYTINAGIPSSVVKDDKGNFSSVDGEYRVTDVMVGDEPIDLEKTYTVACHSYWLTGYGDGMTMFAGAKIVDEKHEMYVDNVMLSMYIRENLEGHIGEEYAEPQGRITIVDEPASEPEETPAEPVEISFTDVTEANWHYEFVMKMAEAGIVNGYADGTFLPGNSVKWGEALKMVMSFAGYEEQAAVEGGTWASGWIAKAQADGLVEGEVDQNAVITRAELCEVLAKAEKIAASENESAFADTDNGYVQALVELGVIGGMPDGTFQPDGELTRAQLCKILATFPENTGEETPDEETPDEETPDEEAPAYIETEITIDVPEQENVPAHTITGILTVPTGAEAPVPGVVMLHGTGSNLHEVNGAYDMAAAEMAKNGLATLRFNFMGIGEGKEAEYVGYSYTSANVDAKAAADYLAGLDAVDGDALAVMGWSQGGTNALLAAAAYPETFKAVVTWAGALDLTGMFEDFDAAAAEAEEKGSWTMEFDWRSSLPFGPQWFEDVKSTDVLEKVKEITAPILAINGEGDTVVDPASGKTIEEASQNELSKNVMIPECDHTLNMFSESMDAINAVIEATCEFLTANLTAGSAEQAA